MSRRYKQSSYKPKYPHKVILSNGKLPFYRSSWEGQLMEYLDLNDHVIKWGSEIITIPYILPNGEQHRYIIDFYVEIYDNNKQLQKYLIEVKPSSQSPGKSQPPKMPKPNNRTSKTMMSYQRKLSEYYKNACKWQAAQQFAKSNGLKFIVMNEDSFNL